ncbi:hypothetical protein C8D92_107202 [Tamilnaduibacter salinus]|uniref:Uncharacterized protein n=1 Tax=Tamilnaduibacter salinus TaxID=1484056 RepID=A0A2A2I7P1_9GAMM|nr:hypothetical protein [Tamilnaduibacter salinus]PAV27408.1 hypothetical protein CF392_00385 [Tamilnaduibacter salinus]PVY75479.1 hypothetical protein C8D92_107202 [Tamilnaduibacter salinus]
MSNTDRYIAIARACLRAINDAAQPGAGREDQIQAVYDAIDDAFNAEFQTYRENEAIMISVLERIATGKLDAQAAADLAARTLAQSGSSPGTTLQ